MKNKSKVLPLLIGGLVFGAIPAEAALPTLNGSWNFTFYPDAARNNAAGTQCIVFTGTGSIPDATQSGTWQSPSLPGWQGNWVQIGNRVRLWGYTSGQSYATGIHGDLIWANSSTASPAGSMTGEYEFYPPPATIANTALGAWSATPVTKC